MIIDARTKSGATAFTQTASPCTGITADVLPEVQKPVLAEKSTRGVSTRNDLDPKPFETIDMHQTENYNHENSQIVDEVNPSPKKQWYALRTTYGREKKAYNYLISKGCVSYLPTIVVDKLVDGRIKSIEVPRIPNIFFAYGTLKEMESFVYDNVHLPFLRFYYRYYNPAASIASVADKCNLPKATAKEPMVVPDRQIESLKVICEAEGQDTIVTTETIKKFRQGQTVRVIDGPFAGAVGIVARFKGQQRVGLVIDGVVTAVTAYVPSGFIEIIK